MTGVLKSCKETVYTVLGALVLTLGGMQLGFTFVPIVHYPIEICLNLISVLGLFSAVLSAIKKSFYYFPMFIISIALKCLFYIGALGYLGLTDNNLSYASMHPKLESAIEYQFSISPSNRPEIQELFVIAGKQITRRLYLAVYILVPTLVVALLTLFLCFSYQCCRIVRYGRRAVREKEVNKAQHNVIIPIPIPEVAPSAPFLDHQF